MTQPIGGEIAEQDDLFDGSLDGFLAGSFDGLLDDPRIIPAQSDGNQSVPRSRGLGSFGSDYDSPQLSNLPTAFLRSIYCFRFLEQILFTISF